MSSSGASFLQRAKQKSCPPRLTKHLAEFFNNTSIHGLKYLTEKRRPLHERIVWLAGLALSTVVGVLLILQSWSHWRASPVIVALDETQRPVWELPFPAITICPETKIRSSMFNFTDAVRRVIQGMRTDFYNLTNEEKQLFHDLSIQCAQKWKPPEGNYSKINNSIIDLIEQYSLPTNFFMLETKFRSNDIYGYKFFQPIMTDQGLCFTFNMLPSELIFSPNTFHASRNYLDYGLNVSWTLNEGYSANAGRDAYPFRALLSGQPMGMSLFLLTPKEDFESTCQFLEEGYKVQLHDPVEVPRPGHGSFRVPLNGIAEVAVTPSEILTEKALRRRYSAQQRQCYFQEERKLRFFVQYSQQNCELECVTNVTLKLCGCVAFYMPRDIDTPVCGHDKLKCMRASDHMFQSMESGLRHEEDHDIRPESDKCNCLQSCNHIRYQSERSYSNLDINLLRRLVPGQSGIDEMYLSKVVIYFKESFFVPMVRMEFSNAVDFLANCGGLLGLCLGMSVISIVEVFYWLLVRPCFGRNAVVADKDHTV